jgi:hypothetical protein
MATNREMLKEAIADAKAVKETAIANAKAALEESFTPRLKEMLSLKLQEMEEMDEMEDNDMYEMEHEKSMEEAEDKDMNEVDLEELLAELNEEEEEMEENLYEEEDEMSDDEEVEGEPLDLEDMTDEDLKKLIEDVIADMIESGDLEPGEGGAAEEDEEMEMEMEDEEEVDLAELLREIEEMEDVNEEELEEGFMDKIVKAVNRFGSSGAVEDLIKIDLPKVVVAGKKLGKLDPSYEPSEEEINKLTASAKEDGGTGSIKIVGDTIKYISGRETKGAAQASTMESIEAELNEAYSTIEILKSELNEINLLNAKLLYTNKIFKAKNLNENQKVKVLSSFDKATTVGEVKLVFETLNEGIKVTKNTIKENLGSASKTHIQPTVKKPIVESNEAFLRMQKLAGLI